MCLGLSLKRGVGRYLDGLVGCWGGGGSYARPMACRCGRLLMTYGERWEGGDCGCSLSYPQVRARGAPCSFAPLLPLPLQVVIYDHVTRRRS